MGRFKFKGAAGKIMGKLGRLLRGAKKPRVPNPNDAGAVAFFEELEREVLAREEREARGESPPPRLYTPPGQEVRGDGLDEFVLGGVPIYVKSSNVQGFQYDYRRQTLYVSYLSGSAYLYHPISQAKARHIVRQVSSGVAVWDHLRLRGTRRGHQPGINYRRVR